VTPNSWNYIGSAYYPNVPLNQAITISNPGILWPADHLPGAGHYCFVAVVGNAWDPAPAPTDFATFDDFVNYIYAHNNITWRNFNVIEPGQQSTGTAGQLLPLPFQITGAWDRARAFTFETNAQLPAGSQLSLELPHWLGHGLMPGLPQAQPTLRSRSPTVEPVESLPVRVPLNSSGPHPLPAVELPAASATASTLYVSIPTGAHLDPCNIVIRQIYNGREVGRIAWVLMPPRLVIERNPSPIEPVRL
jgi:serine protease